MVVLLMGVAGSGKTTVGHMLATELGWAFYDADELHPPGNIAKMRRGIPLEDADRASWLDTVRELVRRCIEQGENAVIACSALKQSYRDHILGNTGAKLVYLRGDPELIQYRLEQRVGHFAGTALLDSQFATLEEPRGVPAVDVSATPQQIVQAIRRQLAL